LFWSASVKATDSDLRCNEFCIDNGSGGAHAILSALPELSCSRPPTLRIALYTKIAYIGVWGKEDSAVARTNIELDDGLVEKAMKLTGARTKREVVDIALRRLVDKGTIYRALRRLKGKLEWEGDVDAWRSARTTDR
jgi:Arc/MetJ family transcription regulator